VKHPKTNINQINKDQTQRTNIKSSKGKTTNNTQGILFFFFFFIHSADLCLLVGAFNPFAKYDHIAIYFIVFGLSLYTLFVFPV